MKRLAFLATAVLWVGCVTQGKYDALQAELDATKTELGSTKGSLDATHQTLGEREKAIAELKSALEQEQAKAKELGEQISKLQSDLSTIVADKSKLQGSVEEMKAALADLQKRKAAADARVAEFRNLLAKFKTLIDSGKLKVKITDGRMVVELATDVLFGSGSSILSRDGKAAVTEVASVLASIPNRQFQVEGHTDNVPIATAQYPSNWELAAARALTVVKTMIDGGMPGNRISAASFADSKPARPNDSPEGKAANRRINIVVVPDLSSLPGFDELNRASSTGA